MALNLPEEVKSLNMDSDPLSSLEQPRAQQFLSGLTFSQRLNGVVLNSCIYKKSETNGVNKWSMAVNVDDVNNNITIEKGVIFKQGYYIINDDVLTVPLPQDYRSKEYFIGLVIDLAKDLTYTGSAVTGDYQPNYDQLSVEFFTTQSELDTIASTSLFQSVTTIKKTAVNLASITNGVVNVESHTQRTYNPLAPMITSGAPFRTYKADTFTTPANVGSASVIVPFVSSGTYKTEYFKQILSVPDGDDRASIYLAGQYRISFACEVNNKGGVAGEPIQWTVGITRANTGYETQYELASYDVTKSGSTHGVNGSTLLQLNARDWVTIRVTGAGINNSDIINARLNIEFLENPTYRYDNEAGTESLAKF